MLFILALLLFPCAIVGAFVTSDDYDLIAFQAPGGCFEPISGALCGRTDSSSAVSKDTVPSRRSAPPRPMVVRGDERIPTTVSFPILGKIFSVNLFSLSDTIRAYWLINHELPCFY